MLTSLRIQNFRSIRDASVKLGQVNLFIGPNNSGKSNALKGIAEAAKLITDYPAWQLPSVEWLEKSIPRRLDVNRLGQFPTKFQLVDELESGNLCEINCSIDADYGFSKKEVVVELDAILVRGSVKEPLDLQHVKPDFPVFPLAFSQVRWQLDNCVVYKPDPVQFQKGAAISNEAGVSADASNLVAYLFYLSQNHKARFRQLEHDLAQCVGNLVSISTPADPTEPGKLKLKFFDQNDVGYWAEEVSEGVLYFLALLCIVHQPDPPKLLLLEEPEKGIHPRRIKEVMAFIFELARLRDIQIILTSHSPYVVDHFKDIPECVSVFDRDPETGETIIHNAKDLIDKTNAEYELQGLPPTDYTSSLGEYWVSGFLGGVPL